MLNEAKAYVPSEKWSTTPIALKATAGLRLLGQKHAEKLLDVVRKVLENSGFLADEDSVGIMDGTDEGIFSWFTVNFLSERMGRTNTIAALDLGGGSTQVTYSISDKKDLTDIKDYVHSIAVLKKDINVFTHSYLGLGLMAVRHAIFTDEGRKNETKIFSECVNPIIKSRSWSYAGVEYFINGKDNPSKRPEVDFDACWNKVKKYVLKLVNPKPISLNQHQIGAFSYYYDRAIETGLVGNVKLTN